MGEGGDGKYAETKRTPGDLGGLGESAVRGGCLTVAVLVLLASPVTAVEAARPPVMPGIEKDAVSPPPVEALVATLESYLLAHAEDIAGARASVKIGRAAPVPARLRSIDKTGVRVEQGGLRFDVSWERLGEEGVCVLARPFMDEASADVHAAHLFLAIRLGLPQDRAFRDELASLWKKDEAVAKRVEAVLEDMRDAHRAERAQAAKKRKEEVKRARSAYEEIATTPSKALRLRGLRGKVISGLRITTGRNDDQPAVEIRDCEDLTITCCEIGPCRHAVRVSGSKNVKLVNCFIHDTSNGPGVVAYKCAGLLVQGNRIERISSGVYALECTGVRVIGNYVENCQGPMPRGQIVQFDKCYGPGNEVRRNYGINYRGESNPEDMINIYKSSGTAESPILIEGNFLMGDPRHGSEDKSGSGSGCMLGDGGGRYITCRGNVCIAPGQVGIGVCGGSDILVEENLVLGTQSNVANVGVYVRDYSRSSGSNITVRKNVVAWKNKNGTENSFWKATPTGFTNVTIEDNDFGNWGYFKRNFPKPPSPAPLPPEPWGEPLFPWKAEEACREKAKKMAGGLNGFP